MYKDKKLRIRCKNQATNASQYNQIVTDLKANYHIHEIRTGKPLDPGTIVKTLSVAGTEVETIRDLHQLEIDLIKKHAKPNLCEEVLKLHAKYKAVNEVKPSAWNIRSLRFMNVFAYGGDHVNTIDFINGIHNLCSPNMTGKSSIVNVIVYALFEKTSQNSSSKIDIVHVGKTEAFIELVFEHNGTGYLIEKTAKLKKKKLGFETNFYQLGDMLSPITPLLSGDSMSPTRKLLNGKDSIQSIAEITNYIGDFESFTTHNIISTKLGSSLIQMSPADKLRHFQKLSKTDQYEDYMKIVKESLKTEETELTQLQARLVKLDSETKGIDIDLEKANVCQYKRQNQASVEQLSILIKTGMDISTEIGTHTARIETLQSQIEVVGQVPTKTLEQATMTLQKNNQKITESTAIDEGSSSMGIKAMIKNYQAQIKPCGDCVNGDCDIENQPTETLKDLQSQKLQLQHQIKVNQDLVKKLKPSTEPSILDFADLMSLKATLTDSLNNKMKPKITINQCKNQIAQIMISQMKVPEEADPNLIRNQLAVKRHELKELQKVLKDYEDILLIETQLDLLRLSDSVRPVEKKIKVETHNLVAKRGPDQTQAQSIIDGLIFKDGLAEIKEEDAKYLSQFIEMSSDIEFLKSEKAKMQRQHNLEVDANIKHNQEIEAQIRWVEKSNLESQMVTLGLAIAYLSETLRYTELNTQLHDLEIFEKIEQIDRQLDLIQFNKYKQLITDDEGTVATIDWTIQWYQKMENLEIQKENHRYQELIEKNQELLAVALLKENNKILTGIIKYWDLVKKNHEIETLIEEANHDLENCQTALKTNQEAILKNQKEDIVIQKKIVILENKVNKYQESLEEIGVLHEKIKVLVEKVDTDTEYVRLFNRNSIPFEIMNFKLTSFNLNVNQIFEPYTKYSFKYEQNDASKLVFLVTNRTSGLVIDPERLSGFESVILQLAINNATLSIADNFRCGFMIIDESMDCLDQTNFNEKLPQMIEALRQYYQNVILISHREIPASIVDKQLRISHYGTYSTINS
jgi:DNA repair exonuclease SbcCD ATPase subunit